MGEVKLALAVHLSSTDRGDSTDQQVIGAQRGQPAAGQDQPETGRPAQSTQQEMRRLP